MKICFFGNGGSIHVQNWCNYFSKNHETHIVTYKNIKNMDKGIVPHKIPRGKMLVRFFMKARKIIKNIEPDVIFSFYVPNYGFTSALIKNRRKFIFVESPLGSDIATFPDKNAFFKFIVKYTLSRSDLIIAQDPVQEFRIKQLLEGKNENILQISWGVDIDLFKPKKMKKMYDIIMVNGLIREKGTHILIKALPEIKKHFPDIKVAILGDGEDKGYLINLAKRLGVYDNIEFMGHIQHNKIPNYLNSSKIFISTDHPITFGHAYGLNLLEAMSCGLPTIVAKRPTVVCGYKKWYFGKLYDADNLKELSETIINLLNDKKSQKQLSKINRNVIKEKFDWNKNMKTIEKHILELIK